MSGVGDFCQVAGEDFEGEGVVGVGHTEERAGWDVAAKLRGGSEDAAGWRVAELMGCRVILLWSADSEGVVGNLPSDAVAKSLAQNQDSISVRFFAFFVGWRERRPPLAIGRRLSAESLICACLQLFADVFQSGSRVSGGGGEVFDDSRQTGQLFIYDDSRAGHHRITSW